MRARAEDVQAQRKKPARVAIEDQFVVELGFLAQIG